MRERSDSDHSSQSSQQIPSVLQTEERREARIIHSASALGKEISSASAYLLNMTLNPILAILKLITAFFIAICIVYPAFDYAIRMVSMASLSNLSSVTIYIYALISFSHFFVAVLIVVKIPHIAKVWFSFIASGSNVPPPQPQPRMQRAVSPPSAPTHRRRQPFVIDEPPPSSQSSIQQQRIQPPRQTQSALQASMQSFSSVPSVTSVPSVPAIPAAPESLFASSEQL